MFFALKRTMAGGVAGCIILAALGIALRHVVNDVPPFAASWLAAALGLAALGAILCSDLLLSALLFLFFRKRFLALMSAFAAEFRGQRTAAMLTGGLMASCEELVFRGLSSDPAWLAVLAVLFGGCHYLRRSLFAIALWAVYEGALLAAALLITHSLLAAMIAHGLHDVVGFALLTKYRRMNESAF